MTELEPIWSEHHIYRRLMEDAFVYREMGKVNVNVLFLEHAQRACGNLQNQYLASLKDREWAWQQQVASRDKTISELQVTVALSNKYIGELEAALFEATKEKVEGVERDPPA